MDRATHIYWQAMIRGAAIVFGKQCLCDHKDIRCQHLALWSSCQLLVGDVPQFPRIFTKCEGFACLRHSIKTVSIVRPVQNQNRSPKKIKFKINSREICASFFWIRPSIVRLAGDPNWPMNFGNWKKIQKKWSRSKHMKDAFASAPIGPNHTPLGMTSLFICSQNLNLIFQNNSLVGSEWTYHSTEILHYSILYL